MEFELKKRIELDDETLREAMSVYETPNEFIDQCRLMCTNEELCLVAKMGINICSVDEIKKIIEKYDLADPEEYDAFIDSAWRRVIINKIIDRDTQELKYRAANFYARFPIFAQYEPDIYRTIPKHIMDAMNQWDFDVYFGINRNIVMDKMKGIGLDVLIHQCDFLTLDEALQAIDEAEHTITFVPCNCKSMVYYHHKPTQVCINLSKKQEDLNSQQSRGYGRVVTKEEAKEMIVQCSKDGLMHIGDYDHYCNCDRVCCYPIKMAETLGSRGAYPRQHYEISVDWDVCDHCGICTKICNFSAFAYDAYKKVTFDIDKCFGCTICTANCPLNCIHLTKIEESLIPGSKAYMAAQK
jgi:ferredoxin